MLIPGLFQLREYAEIVIRDLGEDGATDEVVTRWVDLRMERQQVLDDPSGPKFEAIIDESSLRRQIGGPAFAVAQLRHLGRVGLNPRVTVRVLPTSVDLRAGIEGSFWLFRMPDPYPAVACQQVLGAQLYLEAPKSDRYVRAYDRLRRAALDPNESATFIADLAESMSL